MLNEALRLVRAYHDLSQSELCAQLSISNYYLSEIESGKKQPTLEMLNKYGEHFGIPVSSLLFFSENLHQTGLTSNLRVGAAKKVLALLQWVEAKNVSKSESTSTR